MVYDNNGSSQAYIVIGDGSKVLSGKGGQERAISPTSDVGDAAGAIVIGNQGYARSGSIMIGSHNFKGNMGDVTGIDSSKLETEGEHGVYGHTVATMTVGTNSFTKGFLATTLGNYNIQTSRNVGYGFTNKYNLENFGATVVGTLNSNESYTSPEKSGFFAKSYSGIANSIIGIANRVNNSNGALVYGAGNEITNSVINISGVYDTTNLNDTTKAANTFRGAIRNSNGGGATMAFGGGNVADYTNLTMITGVKNTVKGTADNIIKLDSIIGYNNTVTGASDIKLIGNSNTIEEKANNNIIFGDNYTLKSEKTKNIILGSADSQTELNVSNATILGYNANVQVDGGVALGFGSSLNAAESDMNTSGWDVSTNAASTENNYIWRPTHAAVSVGVSGQSTRRITNVAAGLADTDAVNVAQLKKVAESAGGSGNLIAGDGIKLVKGSDGSWTISTNFTNSGSDNVSYKEVTDMTSTTSTTTTTDGNTTTDNTGISGTNVGTSGTDTAADTTTTQQGKAAVIETTLTADDGNSTTLSESGKLGVKGDDSNITTSVSGSDVKVSLHKDISVNSVTVNDGPTINSTGINMNGKKISNLADGDIYEGSHDAVTGGQLWNVEQGMNNQVRHLDKKINRVGAGAAALAALHPLDFDADDKWNIAAGVGAYKGTSAMALGAFYRPNEVTQLSIGGAFGNGENMWNMGISWRTGSGESYSGKSKAELVRMVNAMEARDAQQDAIIKQQQADIQKQQEGLAKQEAEINELKAMVQQLLAK
ncbi:YadA-like family protein [Veillonella magna]|uniref:YadA-like family protein n=1 Tax=Veillonella magna TaxID=464322 RepID=A0ABS2GHT6_9FIRM|nr:YadA-like family protein [Veillonella magna]MBM6913387.1 YadA-like family protein [Veillonella magna]